MTVVHLTSSTFFGGPERQMLGLARALLPDDRTVFLSFREGGRCRAFLRSCEADGFESHALENDTPRFGAATRELAGLLRRSDASVLCCHGYKADLLGRLAAWRVGVPVVAVSRGWTGENRRVRLYESLDRLVLRRMDRVVCVSEGQAAKVRRAGVPVGRVLVIRNAIRAERFEAPDPADREQLRRSFARPPRLVVAAAGRLSPEKGFDVLVEAAAQVAREDPSLGFILYGEGAQRPALEAQVVEAGLVGTFLLPGFRDDLDRLFPCFDLLVQSSHTEGLPNVALEALAARVPVVATAVGGTPEVVEDGVNGYLVRPGDPHGLARRILELAGSEADRRRMGSSGSERVREHFTFEAQAFQYRRLFEHLAVRRPAEPAPTA